MNIHYNHWNEGYKNYVLKKPNYDLWLDKHNNILSESKEIPIIDLGCGLGNDSLYLSERGYKVIPCDISDIAIDRVNRFVKGVQGIVMDMLCGLPFESSSTKIIIADLSLHYFYWKETVKIVSEIKRVLTPDGYLLCRLNSTKGINSTITGGILLEDNYYLINKSMAKRYFDMQDILKLFYNWNIQYLNENTIHRHEFPKTLWEVILKNS